MDITYMYKNKSLKYDEFIISKKCYLFLNGIFILCNIDKYYTDKYIISGMYLDTYIEIKINSETSYNNFKINKYDGH